VTAADGAGPDQDGHEGQGPLGTAADRSDRAARTERIRARYVELTGSVPDSIERRLALSTAAGREDAVETIENLRDSLIMHNPLGRKWSQVVQFGQLVALGKAGPARLHAGAALRAGATLAELTGAVELALITAGMPAYSLGVEILSELAEQQGAGVSS
jgi:4-carboxymuconolactone decarboxylase